MERVNHLLDSLEIDPFKQRFPWIGGDLQTLRDTFVSENFPLESSERIQIRVPETPSSVGGAGFLLALLDLPKNLERIRGLVFMLHGLGGSSRRQGLRRMSLKLIDAGFAVLRVNLRGADPGRELAGGTYSAKCNSDLIPAIINARQICHRLADETRSGVNSLPLYGVGISLGGTILLNGCLAGENQSYSSGLILDGLVCISSPLDLAVCSASIERPRNFIYQTWLLQRLVRQTLSDPFGVPDDQRNALIDPTGKKSTNISSIRAFDSAITAPRWGFKDVDDYYKRASPLNNILENPIKLPPALFVQSLDDPWVPPDSAKKLANRFSDCNDLDRLDVVLTSQGGHNGFHHSKGCWGDDLIMRWLVNLAS